MIIINYVLATSLLVIFSPVLAIPQAETSSPTTEATPQQVHTKPSSTSQTHPVILTHHPHQTAAFLSALQSYYTSFYNSPAATSLAINLGINLSPAQLTSITQNIDELIPVPTSSFDLASLATDPPLTFTTPTWQTGLAPMLESDVRGAQTSAVLEAARIGQTVLGTSAALETVSPTMAGNYACRETGSGAAMGAAAVAIGAAAVML